MSTDDPTELLHRVADRPVAPLDHDELRQRARRRTAARQLATGALVLALVVGAGTAILQLGPAAPQIMGGGVELPLPPAGHVVAEGVGEVPVFVVHEPDGDVHVLDARSPHDPFPKVLAWCETSQTFEDLWHGSLFSPAGWWLGGPAPSGMARYEVLDVADGRISVGDRQPPPDRGDGPDGLPEPGPRCDIRTALYLPDHTPDPAVLDDLVVHEPEGFLDELWFPTPERVLGQAAGSPLDDTTPSASEPPDQVLQLDEDEFEVLAAEATKDPSLKGLVFRGDATFAWEGADIDGTPPTLPDGTVGVFVIARDAESTCRSPEDVSGVEIVDGLVVVVLDPEGKFLQSCPGPSGSATFTAFLVVIPDHYDEGLTGASSRLGKRGE